MPNFSALAQQGSFRRLTTSIPPQSPVAWSNLITGMNAGGHGIFDFIHRDPKTFQLYFSTSKVEGPNTASSGQLGDSAGQRHGGTTAPWQSLLGDSRRPRRAQFIFRMPANFPPVTAKGKTLSGMGTPDLRGTYGTFTFYTDDPDRRGSGRGRGDHSGRGGRIAVATNLIGPDNTFRKNSPPATEPFTVAVDPLESVARLTVQDQQFVLKEGEWSGWIPVRISADAVHRQCERDLPLLSQADASAISTLCFAHQY